MVFGLRPKEDKFFELFQEGAATIVSGVKILEAAMKDAQGQDKQLEELTRVEKHGDEVVQNIIDLLNRTFVTPFDREDIYMLARELDRILDHMHGTLEKMVLYKTGHPKPCARSLVQILDRAAWEIQKAIDQLADLKSNYNQILNLCEDIKYQENEGDKQYRKAVAALFETETNPIEVIKWKEVYEHLETALDHCEDVANLLKGVALKYA